MKKRAALSRERFTRSAAFLPSAGLLAVLLAGTVSVLYRLCLSFASEALGRVLAFARGSLPLTALWFLVLLALAFAVSLLVRREPLIGGSGIPQLESEIKGKIDSRWLRVLVCKFTGGFLCLLGGLSLGREGPSIQLGAMAGKGLSRALRQTGEEEHALLSCGASAGLAAAFHVHDRSYVQGKMEQFLGKGIGFDGILAVQEENVAFAVHGYGRDGIEGTAGGPEYAALGIDDAVVLHH